MSKFLSMEMFNVELFITTLKNSSITYLKKKLIMLYILNVTDIIFTLFLVNTGYFVESNAVMALFVNNNQLGSLILKLVLPLILICWALFRVKKAAENQLFGANIIITLGLIFYSIINIFHVLWIILYVTFSLFL
jgi:hypothetical protein